MERGGTAYKAGTSPGFSAQQPPAPKLSSFRLNSAGTGLGLSATYFQQRAPPEPFWGGLGALCSPDRKDLLETPRAQQSRPSLKQSSLKFLLKEGAIIRYGPFFFPILNHSRNFDSFCVMGKSAGDPLSIRYFQPCQPLAPSRSGRCPDSVLKFPNRRAPSSVLAHRNQRRTG